MGRTECKRNSCKSPDVAKSMGLGDYNIEISVLPLDM